MASKSKRVFYTVAAVVIGIGIVYGLSIAGDKTQGPIEHALTQVQNTVAKVEEAVILEQKTETRAEKLSWLQPYFSATEKIKNPTQFFFGAYDNNAGKDFQPVINLEDTLHTIFPFIHIYTAWGSKPEQEFPKQQVSDIITLGSIPVITWEPWLVAFDATEHPELKPENARDKGGMQDVANGVYDFYLRQWARQARKIQAPILLRLGHEMNDPYRYPWGPQNNTAADFVAAWKHVHDVFKKAGANNIIWMWSPHPAYGFFKEYYPGDAYVDYVGIGTLNYGPIAAWAKWWSFDEIFGKYYNDLSAFHKPIVLTEFASLAYGGNRTKWYADALKSIPVKYPAVHGLLFFHFDTDNTTTQQVLDWSIINDRKIVSAIRKEVGIWDTSSVKGWGR